jgi:EVE domain
VPADRRGEEAARQAAERRFWLGVVSREHVETGVRGGFAQLDHGAKPPLRRLRAGDGLVFYSPRTSYPDGEPLRLFTAMGVVLTGEVYQVDMGGGFEPYRVDVRYLEVAPAAVQPLVDELAFIRNKSNWGASFRFGSLQVPEADFALIARSMGRDFARDFGAAAAA